MIDTYIVTKRFKGKAICGDVNLPYGTHCECIGNTIYYEDRPICRITSQNAYDYFSRDDDGLGKVRGELVQKIKDKLSEYDRESPEEYENHQKRWDLLWEDEIANKLRRKEHEDFWCWSFDFYNASVADLQHIWRLIGDV